MALDANGNEITPSDSSSGNNLNTEGNPNSAAEPLNPDTESLRYDQIVKKPEFQALIDRQVEKRVQAELEKSKTLAQPVEAESEDVKFLMKQHNLSADEAKAMVAWRDRGLEAKLKPIQEQLENHSKSQELTQKASAFYAANPEAFQHKQKMIDAMKGLNPSEREFVMNSPDGFNWLYSKVNKGAAPVSDTAKFAASSGGGSGGSSAKLSTSGTLASQAIDAFAKGDRAAYERLSQSLMQSRA